MTIKGQTEAIISHPCFKEAIDQYISGDYRLMKHLLSEVQIHIWQKTALTASRVYGRNRWLDSCKILAEIRETPPPDNLDIRFPIPDKKELVIVKVEKLG